jgi:signal peptidase I
MTNDISTKPAKIPSRGIALLLAFFGPWGIGQFYLGQARRAAYWLVGPMAAFTLGVLALPWLGHLVGFGLVFAILIVAVLCLPLASYVDVFLVPGERVRGVRGLSVVGYWVAGNVFIVAVAVVLRAFVIEAFRIPSAAMLPALMVGDHIMVDKPVLAFRTPKRGEPIVFRFPEHREQDFVKRVIAVGGDTLLVKDGHPWINGWEVPHCVVGRGSVPATEREPHSGELDVEYLEGDAYLVFFDDAGIAAGVQGAIHRRRRRGLGARRQPKQQPRLPVLVRRSRRRRAPRSRHRSRALSMADRHPRGHGPLAVRHGAVRAAPAAVDAVFAGGRTEELPRTKAAPRRDGASAARPASASSARLLGRVDHVRRSSSRSALNAFSDAARKSENDFDVQEIRSGSCVKAMT